LQNFLKGRRHGEKKVETVQSRKREQNEKKKPPIIQGDDCGHSKKKIINVKGGKKGKAIPSAYSQQQQRGREGGGSLESERKHANYPDKRDFQTPDNIGGNKKRGAAQ